MSRTLLFPYLSTVVADALRMRASTLEIEADDHTRNGGKSAAMGARATAEQLRVLADSMFGEFCAVDTGLKPPKLGDLPK